MHTEFEIKVLDVDTVVFRRQLKKLGATLKGFYDFKRYIFGLNNENEWIRLRTDGKLSTLTYKNALKDSIDGVKELEITVSDFENTKQLLELTCLRLKTYEENKREEYEYRGASITIDSWPDIPSYVEIEGTSTKIVNSLVSELGLNKHFTTSKTVADIYAHYGVPMKNSI